jgi:membrane-associated phospholipid phosphatase
MNILKRVIELDHQLFFAINEKWSNGFFDSVLPYTRESIIWLPLYLFLLVFIWMNFGKQGLWWALFFICLAACCDLVSSKLIKENIMRARPCRHPEIADHVRFLVNYCPQSSSFTSSHATNHFGMATFIYFTLRSYTSKWLALIFLWAAMIAYAQVYVGVHFPLDVTSGAILGIFIGYLMSVIFNKKMGLQKA